MSEANKNVLRRFYLEVIGQGRVELIEELFAREYVERAHSGNAVLSFEWLKATSLAFRNRVVVMEGLYAEGDLVRCRWSAKLTQTGEFMGVSPAGQTIELSGVGIFRLRDGKIAERWDYDYSDGLKLKLESPMPSRVREAIAV